MQVPGQAYPQPQQPMAATYQQAAVPQQPAMPIQQPTMATQPAQPQAMAVTFLRMIVAVATFLMLIIGFRAKASLVITNHRVVLDVRNYALWKTGYNQKSTTSMTEIESMATLIKRSCLKNLNFTLIPCLKEVILMCGSEYQEICEHISRCSWLKLC